MPDAILKEQIASLGGKTNFVVYGKPVFMKVKSDEIQYDIATLFDVVVPQLDNYEKTLLIMYSNPINEYPIEISVGRSYEDDCEEFSPKYKCNNKEEFEKTIKEILSSKEVLHTISVLFAKASMLEVM